MLHPLRKFAAAYKLHGHMKFQGLDISIENRKGSLRTWKDPHGMESGSTVMHFSYGYIKKTKGTDGDHVDVYVGPDDEATHAFIIDQNKKLPNLHSHRVDGKLVSGATAERSHKHRLPGGNVGTGPAQGPKGMGHVHNYGDDEKTGPALKVTDDRKWTEFDEQKVMLGFESAKEAKDAYLKQYDDPRFFRSMKAMPMDEFREKVLMKSNHGGKVAMKLSQFLDNPDDPLHVPPSERKGKKKVAVLSCVQEAVKQAAFDRNTVDYSQSRSSIDKSKWQDTDENAQLAYTNIQRTLQHFQKQKLLTPEGAQDLKDMKKKRFHVPRGAVMHYGQFKPEAHGESGLAVYEQHDAIMDKLLGLPALKKKLSTNMAAITAGGGPGPSGPPVAPALKPMAAGRPPAPLQPHRAMSMMPTAGRGAGAPAGNAMSMGAAAGPPSAGKGPSPAPKLAETLDMGDAYPPSDEDLVPASERQEKKKLVKRAGTQTIRRIADTAQRKGHLPVYDMSHSTRDLKKVFGTMAGQKSRKPLERLKDETRHMSPKAKALLAGGALAAGGGAAYLAHRKMQKESEFESQLATAGKLMKRPDWKTPHKAPSMAAVAKKPFSRMAKVSDAHGNTLGYAMPNTAKVASLAVACGLAPYQVHTAVFIGSALVKRSGILAPALAIGGVGAGLLAGKKAIDTTKSLATKHRGPHRIRKFRQTAPVMGAQSTSGGW